MKLSIPLPVVCGLFFLMGCAGPVTHNTASGRPEVTISGKVGEKIEAKITDRMLNWGYNVKSSSAALLVFEKPIDNVVAAALLGSQYDSKPTFRMTFVIVETEGSTRVVASLVAITNPGSGFERVTAMNNGKDSATVQQFLTEMKTSLETR